MTIKIHYPLTETDLTNGIYDPVNDNWINRPTIYTCESNRQGGCTALSCMVPGQDAGLNVRLGDWQAAGLWSFGANIPFNGGNFLQIHIAKAVREDEALYPDKSAGSITWYLKGAQTVWRGHSFYSVWQTVDVASGRTWRTDHYTPFRWRDEGEVYVVAAGVKSDGTMFHMVNGILTGERDMVNEAPQEGTGNWDSTDQAALDELTFSNMEISHSYYGDGVTEPNPEQTENSNQAQDYYNLAVLQFDTFPDYAEIAAGSLWMREQSMKGNKAIYPTWQEIDPMANLKFSEAPPIIAPKADGTEVLGVADNGTDKSISFQNLKDYAGSAFPQNIFRVSGYSVLGAGQQIPADDTKTTTTTAASAAWAVPIIVPDGFALTGVSVYTRVNGGAATQIFCLLYDAWTGGFIDSVVEARATADDNTVWTATFSSAVTQNHDRIIAVMNTGVGGTTLNQASLRATDQGVPTKGVPGQFETQSVAPNGAVWRPASYVCAVADYTNPAATITATDITAQTNIALPPYVQATVSVV